MSNFLAVLQAKSAKLSATMGNVAALPVPPIAAPIVTTPVLTPAPIQNYANGPLEVTIELPQGSNRIDVFFSRKPDADILSKLRDAGFWYRPSDKAWYHKDSECNRQICRMLFGAEIEDYDTKQLEVVEAAPIVDDSEESSYDVYKRQCDELVKALGLEFPDLALHAIDCLHRQTFKRN